MMGTTRNDVIDLYPISTPDGTQIFEALNPPPDWPLPVPAPPMQVEAGGGISQVGEGEEPTAFSTIPTERMWSSWDEIIGHIAAGEDGQRSPKITVNPGGAVELQPHSGTASPMSTIPTERMWAPWSRDDEDLREILSMDPHNVEGWRRISHQVLPGWTFHMSPTGVLFTFFTFRSPFHQRNWLLACMNPRYDAQVGHDAHVIAVDVAPGETVPIVCRSRIRLWNTNLGEVRGLASKFAIYHTAVDRGYPAPFSA
jgi:hypothetical protein